MGVAVASVQETTIRGSTGTLWRKMQVFLHAYRGRNPPNTCHLSRCIVPTAWIPFHACSRGPALERISLAMADCRAAKPWLLKNRCVLFRYGWNPRKDPWMRVAKTCCPGATRSTMSPFLFA